MMLTKAIELVVKDTRENTDPELTIAQAIDMVRETGEDCMYETDGPVKAAYLNVLRASNEDVNQAVGVVTICGLD